MNQTAITYPQVTVSEVTGETIKNILEDVCDNLFNPDPYLQQGGDMVRVGGLQYTCSPTAKIGHRIDNLMLRGKPLNAGKTYKLASWAPVGHGLVGEPIWSTMIDYFRTRGSIEAKQPISPLQQTGSSLGSKPLQPVFGMR